MFLISGLDVIKHEFVLKLKIKCNGWLLADTCPQAADHCALFEFEAVLKFYNLESRANMGLVSRKPVFGVFKLVRLSSACSHTNTTVKLFPRHSKED